MYLDKKDNISGHIIIVDPDIHKKAKLTREEFLDRVSHVEEIRTAKNYSYISFYVCSFEDYNNLKKFHDLINFAQFDFKNRYCFAVAVQPKLYDWFKSTDYSTIEKQITFWLASLYFFVPEKRHIVKKQLYAPLFEEILILVDTYYKDYQIPDFEVLTQKLIDEEDETIFIEREKCKKEYLEQCNKFYKTQPPEFLNSPFGYDEDKDWGINGDFGFEFIEAYFLEKDWEHIIIHKGKDPLKRSESRSDLWEKWKHTYATFDQRHNPVYSFYFTTQQEIKKRKREIISKSVRDDVWKRDEGKCVECGSKEKLEFDHIIPFIKGGSSTYRNIQLLCESCNRTKHSKIGH